MVHIDSGIDDMLRNLKGKTKNRARPNVGGQWPVPRMAELMFEDNYEQVHQNENEERRGRITTHFSSKKFIFIITWKIKLEHFESVLLEYWRA